MIFKILLVGGVIAVVYFVFIKKKPLKSSKKATNKEEKAEVNDMVECATCGVYTQLNDCILSNSKYYCSKECLAEAK